MSAKPTTHILIIGGGVAGNALALFLHKANSHPLSVRNFTFSIYEAYPPSEKEYLGGGLGLAPNGVACLAALGLLEPLVKHAGLSKASSFWTDSGTLLGRYNQEDGVDYGMYCLMRSTLYDILREESNRLGIAINYEKRAIKVVEKDDQVFVEFEDGTSTHGDYLIACDGVHSIVRKEIFPGYPEPEFVGVNGGGGFVLAKDLPPNIPPEIKDASNFIFGKPGFFGVAPASDGGLMWWTNWASERPLTPEEIRNNSDVCKFALDMFEGRKLIYPCRELIAATHLYIKGSIFDIQTLPSWHTERVCLIGDAAHAVSPNSGQGASMALEDTSLLALLMSRSQTLSAEQVFAPFEKARRERVEQIVKFGRDQKKNKTEVSTIGMWIRTAFMYVFFRLPYVKNLMGKAWSYRIDWEEPEIGKVVKEWRNGKLVSP